MTEPGNGRAVEVRVALLEERATQLEARVCDMQKTLDGINGKLTAILATLATSAVLLALNLVVNGVKP
jgi:hypothetical protein